MSDAKPRGGTVVTDPRPTLTKTETHRFETRPGYYGHEAEIAVPVLWIEYHRAGGRFRPFGVITAWDTWDVEWCRRDRRMCFHDSGSGAFVPYREYVGAEVIDRPGGGKPQVRRPADGERIGVEFVGRATLTPGRFVDPKAGVPVWWDREFLMICRPKRDGGEGRPVADPDHYLRSIGYRPLAEPLEVEPGVVNPFDTDDFRSFGDSDCFYCTVCRDWLPTDDCDELCRHVRWCERHGWWGGPGSGPDGCCGQREPRRAKTPGPAAGRGEGGRWA